jgi:hypothetical protein
MVPGDHREAAADGASSAGASHWERWHGAYDNPASPLSERLRLVQAMVRGALDDMAPAGGREDDRGRGPAADGGRGPGEPIRIISLCAGQGRDVIDVLATHPRAPEVEALLVELDPALAEFARRRAAEAGLGDRVRVEVGDASLCRWYADSVPADLVLVCGIFGNISASDITGTIAALLGFCAPGGHVVWTRHRLPPDHTPAIRADFAAAGFTELGFESPDGAIQGVGHHRLDGPTVPFDPGQRLFQFVGDGWNPV